MTLNEYKEYFDLYYIDKKYKHDNYYLYFKHDDKGIVFEINVDNDYNKAIIIDKVNSSKENLHQVLIGNPKVQITINNLNFIKHLKGLTKYFDKIKVIHNLKVLK